MHRDIGTTIIGQLIIKTNYTTSVGANLKMNILLQITVRSSKIPHKKDRIVLGFFCIYVPVSKDNDNTISCSIQRLLG